MASRKRKALSLEEKLDVLNAVDRQPARKRVDIAKDLGLPPSTLNSIVSKRAEIQGNAALFGPKAKQARGAKYGNLDESLLTWFKQARTAGVNFDGSILREKAMEIADRLGISDFAASNGWIDRFRKRHGIAYKTHCFARCGFRMDGGEETATEAEETEAASPDQELSEALNALGATGVTYDDYVAVDAAVATSECRSVAEIVADSVASEVSDCGDDEEHEPYDSRELADPSFGEALQMVQNA
nr:tigger transposable element-derived protein 6-like [Dermacentor andersoni]